VLGAEQKTIDFRLMGTPAYMSPEQVMGEEVDGRSDLYSVGVLFYRLLTGALPFAADTALAMLQRQIRDNPMPLSTHRAGLPDWCEQIVQRALAKTPADRFQSAEEFRDALARATGPLPMADLAKSFALGMEGLVLSAPIAETIDLSRQHADVNLAPAVPPGAALPAPARFAWAQAAAVILAVALGIALAAVAFFTFGQGASATPSEAALAEPEPPASVARADDRTTSVEPSGLEALAPAADMPQDPIAAPPPAPAPPAPRPAPRRPAPVVAEPVSEPVEPVERRPVRPVPEIEPSLVFETRALVGTRKPREQGAQLVMGEGKITIIPQEDPTTPLCSFAYSRVLSISVSRSRDPLWNSPQGPAPVARAGGALSRLGIQVSRDWIALRTSTEEQFVAMRFDEVLLKRVLLALEERTGQTPQFIELPREKDGD
jgi:hypothetical protein